MLPSLQIYGILNRDHSFTYLFLLSYFRTLRFVPEESKDKIASDENVLQTLLKTFRSLFVNDLNRQMCLLNVIPEIKSKYPEIHSVQSKTIPKAVYNDQERQRALNPEEVLFSTLGFSIIRQPSSLESAGIGVFVAKGFVPEGTVVSMYPGMEIFSYKFI